MFANGDDTAAPVRAPYEIVSQMACLHAAFGTLLAIRARGMLGGRGQHVDLSRQEAVLWSQNSYISRYSLQDDISRREGHHSAFGAVNGAPGHNAAQVVLQDLGLGARTTEGLATGDSQLAKVGDRSAAVLERCKPIYEDFPGWDSPTAGVTDFDDLPEGALAYVRRLEELIGRPIDIISTGPYRHETIEVRSMIAA